jgi:ABC-type transport system involved in multi-copper enzyme maturation permease subunit
MSLSEPERQRGEKTAGARARPEKQGPIMFAVGLELERDPLQWAELPLALKNWVQHAGLVAAIGLFIFCLAYLIQGGLRRQPLTRFGQVIAVLACLSFATYLPSFGLFWLLGGTEPLRPLVEQPVTPTHPFFTSVGDVLFFIGGLFAITAVALPLVVDFPRLRLGRIGALARLSLKEAFRKKVIWAFAVIAVIFLFAGWFLDSKPEDQLRNYVRVIYWSLPLLFLLVAGWLGAFSIPTDVKNQSIHTIVTKPVERFEIVLGRFFGYGILLTMGLAILAAIGLLYVVRGVRVESAQESMTARMPIFADYLEFEPGFSRPDGTRDKSKQESVGREWGYRSYIGGPGPHSPPQWAIWSFNSLPTYFPSSPVYFEFTFDIFRLTKGTENRGVFTTFTFVDGAYSMAKVKEVREDVLRERTKLLAEAAKTADKMKQQGVSAAKIKSWRAGKLERIQAELISQFKYYDVQGQEVVDYHTQTLVGAETKDQVGKQLALLFSKLAEEPRPKTPSGQQPPPILKVLVSVDQESAAQKLGVAKRDLYVLAAEGPFWANFFKGIIGMWCTIMLVLGIALAASTYLSGVISFLVTMFLLIMGFFKDYVQEIAAGVTSGPMRSLVGIVTGRQAAPTSQDDTASLINALDDVYRFFMQGFLNIIPDVDRFDLHLYVANGFDISWMPVLLLDNLLPVVAYLVPCAILGFYLMKFREVANPT